MKRTRTFAAFALAVLLVTAPFAQHEHHGGPPRDGSSTSALTAEAVQQLLNGEGMGLARPAELNGYPGPKHVLELKEALALTPEQESKVSAVREQMLNRARPLGRQIVEAERAMDTAFHSGRITAADLATRTNAIAGLNGELRRVHLEAHLLTRPLLTEAQVKRYIELRASR